jgi:hypothetical protein
MLRIENVDNILEEVTLEKVKEENEQVQIVRNIILTFYAFLFLG